jgi:ectoine hydroxylase-related dioxygenase (phytanoyl-CoA dioxygenase family)
MHSLTKILSNDQVQEFHREGLLILRSFYDQATEIEPIQWGIHQIIGMLIRKYNLPIQQKAFTPDTFDSGYQSLIAHDRKFGAEVYDAVKLIPAFVRLACCERHDHLVAQVRDTDFPGIAVGGFGIRIDNPAEERYRADWHQEYPAQLRSVDGVVFWSPLVPIDESLGPVRFCRGSHKDGLVRVHTRDPEHPEKTGAYGLILENRDERISRYPHTAPLLCPGDLAMVDFLTLHASGHNMSQRSRWSMQVRYFNFREATGIRIGWRGSYAAGIDFTKVHPELVVD